MIRATELEGLDTAFICARELFGECVFVPLVQGGNQQCRTPDGSVLSKVSNHKPGFMGGGGCLPHPHPANARVHWQSDGLDSRGWHHG